MPNLPCRGRRDLSTDLQLQKKDQNRTAISSRFARSRWTKNAKFRIKTCQIAHKNVK